MQNELQLQVGSLISFTYPITGGTYTAKVISNTTSTYLVAITGFPQGAEHRSAGETATVQPQWINTEAYTAYRHVTGLVSLG
jgi:hypothetical protein